MVILGRNTIVRQDNYKCLFLRLDNHQPSIALLGPFLIEENSLLFILQGISKVYLESSSTQKKKIDGSDFKLMIVRLGKQKSTTIHVSSGL